ncbi:MAG: DedA family protein [Comamonadaceae bacterium]|nr:MAG: DedA family protein [Comamonadaceae bacterium]
MLDAILPFLHSLQGLPAYSLLFALLFSCGIGAPINEDILLLAAAALTLNGVMDPVPLIVVSWFGLLAGDALVFHWGHRFGSRALRHRWGARIVSPERLESVQDTMRRYGPAYIFVVRFLPGIRTMLFFAAGSLKMPYRHLFVFDGIAAAIELPLLVYAVRYIGGRWQEITGWFERSADVLMVLLLIALLVVWVISRRRSAQTKVR